MAIDQTLLDLAAEQGLAVLRLYRWQPSCLSFGRHEPALRRYGRARVEALGVDVVRRPTGGRAVWHARELTYAMAAPAGGEVLVGGRKVVGSAQRRERDAILQHGAVLLEDDQRPVHELSGDVPDLLPEIPLSDALGRLVTWDQMADAIEGASAPWADAWATMPPAEIVRLAERHGDRFRDPAWTWAA